MLTIVIPGLEYFNEETEEFTYYDDVEVQLEHSLVSVSISDLSGSIIEKSSEQYQSSGSYKLELQSGNLAKGIYMCTLTINGIPSTKPLIIQ